MRSVAWSADSPPPPSSAPAMRPAPCPALHAGRRAGREGDWVGDGSSYATGSVSGSAGSRRLWSGRDRMPLLSRLPAVWAGWSVMLCNPISASYATSTSLQVPRRLDRQHRRRHLRGLFPRLPTLSSPSYWDLETSGLRVGVGSDDTNDNGVIDAAESQTAGIEGKSTVSLQSPTSTTGIYQEWRRSLNIPLSTRYPDYRSLAFRDGCAVSGVGDRGLWTGAGAVE